MTVEPHGPERSSAARAGDPPAPFVLWLLRHGEAVPAAEGGDTARMLSAHGERVIADLAAALAAAGWRPARVFASPLRRAQDTARLVLARVASGLALETLPELDPDGDAGAIVPALRARDALRGALLLVGHQPLLGILAARLVGDPEPRFTPGTLVGIAFDGEPRAGAGRIVETRRPGA